MKDFEFNVNQSVLNLGVKIITARIDGVKNSKTDKEFEEYKKVELNKIKNKFINTKYKDDPILEGFRNLHLKVGRSNRDYVASPEGLRQSFVERESFPQINLLVDIYNLISLKTGLALGAHDIKKIVGNITLRLTKGDEIFIPLGKSEPKSVFSGEYAYVDDANNIICRLEVLQVEPTKVTLDVNDVFLIIQGNENTSDESLLKSANEVCELITKYCGGRYQLLN